MALFKVCRGKESSIPADVQNGYVYMCTDTKNIFMDWIDSAGTGCRSQMNAEYANKLRYYISDDEYIEIDAADVASHLNDKDNPHEVKAEQLGIYIASTNEVKSFLGI